MTIVMLNYKRFDNIRVILPAYARYERVAEMIVWTTNCEEAFDAAPIMVGHSFAVLKPRLDLDDLPRCWALQVVVHTRSLGVLLCGVECQPQCYAAHRMTAKSVDGKSTSSTTTAQAGR